MHTKVQSSERIKDQDQLIHVNEKLTIDNNYFLTPFQLKIKKILAMSKELNLKN